MSNRMLGADLAPAMQKAALARFAHRYTGNHVPAWVRGQWNEGYPHFRNDEDWLAHTHFFVTANGSLDARQRHCESSPTWPYGKPPTPAGVAATSPEQVAA